MGLEDIVNPTTPLNTVVGKHNYSYSYSASVCMHTHVHASCIGGCRSHDRDLFQTVK